MTIRRTDDDRVRPGGKSGERKKAKVSGLERGRLEAAALHGRTAEERADAREALGVDPPAAEPTWLNDDLDQVVADALAPPGARAAEHGIPTLGGDR